MEPSLSFQVVQRCILCESDASNHAAGCPAGTVEILAQQVRHIECPCCNKRAVDLNNEDFYECRECKRQFTTSSAWTSADGEIYFIDDPRQDDMRQAYLLAELGTGRFSQDVALAEARAKLEEAVSAAEE